MPTPSTVSKTEVKTAAIELASMRSSLNAWLKFRTLNDRVLAGAPVKLRVPAPYARRMIAQTRDMAIEQDLADKLHALLGELMPDTQLPSPDVSRNPQAAVELAQIAIVGATPAASSSSLGAFPGATHPWLWPVLIVGAVLLTVTTAIKSAADVAKDREEKACIAAGACTDFGFWLKIGGVAMLAYVAWNQFGVKDLVRGALSKRRT